MTVKRQVFLHFVELVGIDHADRVFLTIDRTSCQCRRHFGPRDRGGITPKCLDHFDEQRNRHDTDFKAFHVFRLGNCALGIGEVAETGFAIGQGAQARFFKAMLGKLFSEIAIQNLPCDIRIREHIRDVENRSFGADFRERTGNHRHGKRAILGILQQVGFPAKRTGREKLNFDAATRFSFDNVFKDLCCGTLLRGRPFSRINMGKIQSDVRSLGRYGERSSSKRNSAQQRAFGNEFHFFPPE